jgi:hypothetical protein
LSFRHSLRIRALASVLLLLRVLALNLGDRAWVAGLRLLVALPLPADLRGVLGEAAEILEEGPPGTTLLRRMVSGTTRAELEDMLWGVLVFDEGVLP